MIGKLLNLPYQKFAKTVHGEMEQNKRRSPQKEPHQDEKDESKDANVIIPQEEASNWIKELNGLECYVKNDLRFILSIEGQYYIVKLIDKHSHTVQEYLPLQFKDLYAQLKKDKADSTKGTILNVNC